MKTIANTTVRKTAPALLPAKTTRRVTRPAAARATSGSLPSPSEPTTDAMAKAFRTLGRENKSLRRMLLATTEAIENTRDLRTHSPYLATAHQNIAAKARKLLVDLRVV